MKRKREPKNGMRQTSCPRKIQKTVLRNKAETAMYRINKSQTEKSAELLGPFRPSQSPAVKIMERLK